MRRDDETIVRLCAVPRGSEAALVSFPTGSRVGGKVAADVCCNFGQDMSRLVVPSLTGHRDTLSLDLQTSASEPLPFA